MNDHLRMMEAMSYVSPELVERAEQPPTNGPRRLPRTAVIAACLCLVLAGTALAGEVLLGVRISDFFTGFRDDQTDRSYSGFTIEGGITYLPAEDLSDEARAQAMEAPQTSQLLPFLSWDDAEDYFGLELQNNALLNQDHQANRYYSKGWERCYPCTAWLASDTEDLTAIDLSAMYELENSVRIEVRAAVYTERMDYMKIPSHTNFYPDGSSFTQEDYTTPSGLKASILEIDSPSDELVNRRPYYTAVFTLNGALFQVEAAYDPDPARALDSLKEILDAFQ